MERRFGKKATSHQPPDAIRYLEATFSAVWFGILILQSNQEQPRLNKSTQFSKQSLCFPILHLGKKKKEIPSAEKLLWFLKGFFIKR